MALWARIPYFDQTLSFLGSALTSLSFILLLLVKPDKKPAILVVLVYDAKVFVTSMTSLGPCLLLRGRNMADQWRTQKLIWPGK